jgi:hypothetical protein
VGALPPPLPCVTRRPQACSEYHYLLLYADRLAALNQVSGKVVSEVGWGPGSHASSIVGEGQPVVRFLSGPEAR